MIWDDFMKKVLYFVLSMYNDVLFRSLYRNECIRYLSEMRPRDRYGCKIAEVRY